MNADKETGTAFHWTYLVVCLSVLVAASLLRIDPEGHLRIPALNVRTPDTCLFKQITGAGCPGCGLTRCFVSIAHGNIHQAWGFNPAGFLLFPLVAAQIPYHALQIWRIRNGLGPWRPLRLSSCLAYGLVTVLMVQWAYRWLS
jgi:hypothetical protein